MQTESFWRSGYSVERSSDGHGAEVRGGVSKMRRLEICERSGDFRGV